MYMYAEICEKVCVYLYICIHIYIYTYICMYIYIHLHTQLFSLVSSLPDMMASDTDNHVRSQGKQVQSTDSSDRIKSEAGLCTVALGIDVWPPKGQSTDDGEGLRNVLPQTTLLGHTMAQGSQIDQFELESM